MSAMTRPLLSAFFAACLAGALWVSDARQSEFQRLAATGGAVRELLERAPNLFPEAERRALGESAQQLALIGWQWPRRSPEQEEIDLSICQIAVGRIVAVLDSAALTADAHQQWPSGKGTVVVRQRVPGEAADTAAEVRSRVIDLQPPAPVVLDSPRTTYWVLHFENARAGSTQIQIRPGGRELVLTVDVPPPAKLQVEITDESGNPTPAAAALYAPDGQLLIPAQAISFDEAGEFYRRGRSRGYREPRFWPGNDRQREAFFVDGALDIAAAEGEYTLIAAKGFEYVPVVRSVRVSREKGARERVVLRRWIDMPARGWISGDGHVHYARPDQDASRRLLIWTRAEDVHVSSVMRMGDAARTYFEQYAFGARGRAAAGTYSLAPGQEDPRTDEIGHVLAMNLQAPHRRPDRYYVYDLVLDELRRQGGLTGYAHVYQPPRQGFWVRRDMALNIPRGRIDFLEVSEFGAIDDRLYHEFLNLGFRLTATAGSDVPWGNTVGASRVYAYTGGSADPDAWFRAVREGRTFVTTGPMLTFTVNGQPPGSELRVRAGETVRVEAIASGHAVLPRYLEIVSQGEVVKWAGSGQTALSLRFDFPVKRSAWISARCAGALTTPVYLRVGDEPHWKPDAVPALVEVRLRHLAEVEELARRRNVPDLLTGIAEARAIYREILGKAGGSAPKL